MSSEVKNIHEFDFEVICDYYAAMERQGPGSNDVTIKALSFVEGLTNASKIVDLGCGTGGQTITLANHAKGDILGIDIFPKFIEIFNQNVALRNLSHRVKGNVGSMGELTFLENEIDLFWSEGAIYNIGFENGINSWRKYLKKGAHIAVSEVSWFTENRPDEINTFWTDAYPEIDTIPNKMAQIQKAGYIPVASFILPEICWTENFYLPQVKIQDDFLNKYKGNKMAIDLVENQRHEAALYHKYKDYYGYVFYIAKKI